jgi:hypothetical protein
MHSAQSSSLWVPEGTEITTEAKPNLPLPSRTWIITEKLEELSFFMTQQDIDDGHKLGFAAAKFLCHPMDDPKKLAFMRIYRQIPICGFEFAPSSIRASQAIPQQSNRELMAFKTLKHLACPVVPQLLGYQDLGYQDATQGDNEIVPGGYEISIVWEKVPGEPLSQDYFWSLNEQQRDSIREEFRRVYQ